MAKNTNTSMLDMGQLWKRMFHSDHDALRVINATDIESEFSLSHEDGDSILSKKESSLISAGTEVDAKHLSQVMAYGNGTLTLKASNEISITLTVTIGQVLPICALSLLSDVNLVGQ